MKKQLIFWILTILVSINSSAVNVTFQVDMNYAPAFDTVFIAADFQGWCANCTPLSDPQGDGTWSVTLDVPIGPHEYKFTLGNWTNNVEDLFGSGPCSIAAPGNRTINITGPAVVPLVCYNSCYSCDQTYHDVNFSIDMNYVPAFDDPNYTQQVFVYGDFNGWCSTCDPLTDVNNDGIWETTILLAAGSYEYKFSHDAWTGQEALLQGSPCTVSAFNFTNRSLTVGNAPMNLNPVCYGLCTACNGSSSVTFKVDMSNYTGAINTGVFLNGNFNQFCGSCNPMTDANSDDIWETTMLLANDTIEYLFSVDGWSAQEQFTVEDAACTFTNNGFTNRYMIVSTNTSLPAVCYESCSTCPGAGLSYFENKDVKISPNPSKGKFVISSENGIYFKNVTNVVGEEILLLNGPETSIDLERFDSGIYFLNYISGQEIQTIRLVKN